LEKAAKNNSFRKAEEGLSLGLLNSKWLEHVR